MPHILFIHPDQKLTNIYHKHLSPHFSIDSAQDGLAGLRKIRQAPPKLIVSEHKMPYISGLTLLKYVRKHPQLFSVPFFFLSKHEMPESALGLGASGWLKTHESTPQDLLALIVNHFNYLHKYKN